nr:unnamed protein product [Callosobruchus analis]
MFVINNPCDVLVLSETWLCDVEASFYNLNGYKAVNACRQKRGGGVTFYVKEGIYFQEIGTSKYDDLFNHAATRVTSNTSTIIDHAIACQQTKNFCLVSVKNNPLSDLNRLNIIIKQKIKIYQKKCTYESLSISHKKIV